MGLDGQEQFFRAGSLWLQVGRYADAEKRFDRALSSPSLRFFYEALAGRGAARYGLGRHQEGLADMESAKAFDPERALAYALLSQAFALNGRREAALGEIRGGLEKDPENEMLLRQQNVLTHGPLGPPDPSRAQPRKWEE